MRSEWAIKFWRVSVRTAFVLACKPFHLSAPIDWLRQINANWRNSEIYFQKREIATLRRSNDIYELATLLTQFRIDLSPFCWMLWLTKNSKNDLHFQNYKSDSTKFKWIWFRTKSITFIYFVFLFRCLCSRRHHFLLLLLFFKSKQKYLDEQEFLIEIAIHVTQMLHTRIHKSCKFRKLY